MQEALRPRLRLADDFGALRRIAGVDVGYDRARGLARASVAVLDMRTLSPLELRRVSVPVDFPYIPGLLSFREIPAILAALRALETDFDLLMVDGHGIAHPRRLGIAAHLGVLLDRPCIGVAKSRLTGSFRAPRAAKGSRSALMDGRERIGTVLRSREGVAPLFISPGHRVSLDSAARITLRCLTRYRLPEPTRLADKHAAARLPACPSQDAA